MNSRNEAPQNSIQLLHRGKHYSSLLGNVCKVKENPYGKQKQVLLQGTVSPNREKDQNGKH